MASQYGIIRDGDWTRVIIPRPSSFRNVTFEDDASEDDFRSAGLWPVVVNDPGPSRSFQERVGQSRAADSTTETIVETVVYELIPVNERKSGMKEQARDQFEAALQSGFSFDGGTWAPVGERRQRVLEIVAGINAGRGLPQGKTALTFRDKSSTTHSFNETQILDFAEAASDLIDAAETRLEELNEQIAAATTHSDLDAIDVTSGWP